MKENLFYLFAAFVPALIYLSLIYLRTNLLIDLRKSLNFFFYGFSSVLFIFAIFKIAPDIQTYIEYYEVAPKINDPFNLFFKEFYLPASPTEFAVVFQNFIQVGLLEEVTKFIFFVLGLRLLKKESRPNTLFSYMFYSCIVAAGFGMVENFIYFTSYATSYTYNQMSDLILSRSSYSVVLHMEAGLIIGYFYAISTLFKNWLAKIGWGTLGIVLATVLHGLFNYQFDFWDRPFWLGIDVLTASVVCIGLLLCYIMAGDLAKRDGDRDKLWSLKGKIFDDKEKTA